MIPVFRSHFTPGIKASQTKFNVGERLVYQLLDGSRINVTVASGIMHHDQCRNLDIEEYTLDEPPVGTSSG